MITDEDILKKFFGPSGRINSNYSTIKYMKENCPDFLHYLQNRYPDSESIRETLIRIKYHMEERPKCPICGKPVKWNGRSIFGWFDKTCGSGACYCKLRDATMIDKYGITNFGGTEESVAKIRETKLQRYGDAGYNNYEKIKQTCLEKYGKTNAVNIQKTKDTCIKRYGGIGGASPIILEKMQQTCLKKYGVDNYRKTQECVNKIFESRKKNHTVTSSQIEDNCYKWLVKEYGEDDIIRQYVDIRYSHPISHKLFHCDFYIKSLDIFIEIQCYWGHGFHPFDKNNPNDLKTVEKWKSKNKQCYHQAIINWTQTDVIKREVAMANNLKYLEIFSIKTTEEELISKIKNL